ncbi:MAG: hypothetical protein HRT67_08885 [Flavobacteriaceae bacterium]|nr:hypothetical protein [Flavobacteriaceae bacterium]
MSFNHIVTPLDSAQLDSKKQYNFYHKMIDFTLKELIVAVQRQHLCNQKESTLFKQYCDLLLYSIEAMRIKYMYDEEDNMKIDLTESGFPNYLEFRYLFNDLELKKTFINKLKTRDEVKTDFLDTLFRKKEPIRRDKLFEAASIVYYDSVQQKYIFNRFVQGKILEVGKEDSKYLTSWSFYDVASNRPYICYMYFNYKGKHIEDQKEALYKVLKATADREMTLDAMAYTIDRKLETIYPKHIKRIEIGPIHNVFAKDENEITHALLEGISKKELPLESYAISLKIDEVFTSGEFKEGSFFKKQTFQKWDDILKQRYVFAPHRMIQMLHNKTPEVIHKLAKSPIQLSDLKNER